MTLLERIAFMILVLFTFPGAVFGWLAIVLGFQGWDFKIYCRKASDAG